jgi:predicted NUDIX family NTP pyrophosphohydrolase
VFKKSAGILAYRLQQGHLEVFLVHPGGPFFAQKDQGVWSIPKGEFDEEDSLTAAKREFHEETGISIDGSFVELTPLKQKGGKTVYAWAIEKDLDAENIVSNEFELRWPPWSDKTRMIPEVDRAEWFDAHTAMEKINPGQAGFIRELTERLKTLSGR